MHRKHNIILRSSSYVQSENKQRTSVVEIYVNRPACVASSANSRIRTNTSSTVVVVVVWVVVVPGCVASTPHSIHANTVLTSAVLCTFPAHTQTQHTLPNRCTQYSLLPPKLLTFAFPSAVKVNRINRQSRDWRIKICGKRKADN